LYRTSGTLANTAGQCIISTSGRLRSLPCSTFIGVGVAVGLAAYTALMTFLALLAAGMRV
jgi:hypothetical protein